MAKLGVRPGASTHNIVCECEAEHGGTDDEGFSWDLWMTFSTLLPTYLPSRRERCIRWCRRVRVV
eukprot:8676-Eustigmatos_ZCMA.PRE.1